MAEWFARYPNDNGEYEIVFRGTYEEAKKIEKVCHDIIDDDIARFLPDDFCLIGTKRKNKEDFNNE